MLGKDIKDKNPRLTAKHSLSRFVRATYGVASAYVLADTVDKANKMNKVRYHINVYLSYVFHSLL